MAIRIVREKGDAILTLQAKPVKRFDAILARIAEDMVETMHYYNGVGLAATQIGIPKQIIVIDMLQDGETKMMINPVLLKQEGSEIDIEGCLSIPGIYGEVERAAEVKVSYQGINGEINEIHAKGLLARAIQHEYDHLRGILFEDKVIRFIPQGDSEMDEYDETT